MNKHDLTVNELLILQSELRSKQKNLAAAYLMLLGGHLGLHRFYVRRYKTGILQLGLFLFVCVAYIPFAVWLELADLNTTDISTLIVFSLIVAIPAIGLLIWVIIDLFRIKKFITQWNDQVEAELIQQIVSMRPQTES